MKQSSGPRLALGRIPLRLSREIKVFAVIQRLIARRSTDAHVTGKRRCKGLVRRDAERGLPGQVDFERRIVGHRVPADRSKRSVKGRPRSRLGQ